MGKLEAILDAIDPLYSVVNDIFITYYVGQDTIDIFFKELRGVHAGGLLFRMEENETLGFYFILVPSPLYPFIIGREELMRRKDVIVFSGQNVFQALDIDYSYHPRGFFEDLNELSQLIHDNSSRLLGAFSEENIGRTYDALITMKRSNEEIVRNAVRHYIFLPDW